MPNETMTISVDGKELTMTGEDIIAYAGQEWVVERATMYRSHGPNGETGYEVTIVAWLSCAPMPEGIREDERVAESMSDEAAQGKSDTSNVPVQT